MCIYICICTCIRSFRAFGEDCWNRAPGTRKAPEKLVLLLFEFAPRQQRSPEGKPERSASKTWCVGGLGFRV